MKKNENTITIRQMLFIQISFDVECYRDLTGTQSSTQATIPHRPTIRTDLKDSNTKLHFTAARQRIEIPS